MRCLISWDRLLQIVKYSHLNGVIESIIRIREKPKEHSLFTLRVIVSVLSDWT